MKKSNIITALIAIGFTGITTGVIEFFRKDDGRTIKIEHVTPTPISKAAFSTNNQGEVIPVDFSMVAERVMDAVVHIKTTQAYESRGYSSTPDVFRDFFENDPFREFFFKREGPQRNREPRLQVAQGSGVLISEDGYIVTNNHVVEGAEDLEVTLHDNRSFKASIVGTDPTTDLALLKIQERGLVSLPFVDSDEVKVGEWVMAVGNPFNLTSTVTAGIVSAKGRNINILKDRFAVESFIQTDAAINRGNSGGALVNLQGGLIGINTAIASPTGTYSGYGFAIPANIAKKVVEDLIQYGIVQRGVLGVTIRTVDGNLKQERGLSVNEGAMVDSLLENSAAGKAGIKAGDVITSVNDVVVSSSPELQELIARHRPGDQLVVGVDRQGSTRLFDVTLNNRNGGIEVAKREHKEVLAILGADLKTLDQDKARKLGIEGGVIVRELYPGKLRRNTNMREGFIIRKVDGKVIRDLDDLSSNLNKKKGGVLLEGVYEDIPGSHYYAFGLDEFDHQG